MEYFEVPKGTFPRRETPPVVVFRARIGDREEVRESMDSVKKLGRCCEVRVREWLEDGVRFRLGFGLEFELLKGDSQNLALILLEP